MKFANLDLSQEYSYADYLKWTFEERLELIKGKIFKLNAPNRVHQKASMEIARELSVFLKRKTCEVYCAPFDVRLPRKSKRNKKIDTVVQPDIVVVCDPAKLDKKGCLGAPDIVVEILSPGNSEMELFRKYDLYAEVGVKDYWIVLPDERIVIQHTQNCEGKFYTSRPWLVGDQLQTLALPGFKLDLGEVFSEIW